MRSLVDWMMPSQYSPGVSDTLNGTLIGRIPLITCEPKVIANELENVLPALLELENVVLPLVPNEPVVTPPLVPI